MRSRRSRPTLSDIAAEAGISTATVSKVLNGRTDVASATRERVTALLKTHNYPAMSTRGALRSGLVDLVIGGLDSPWAIEILRGVEAECTERGVGTVVSRVRENDATAARTLFQQLDGELLVSPRMELTTELRVRLSTAPPPA